jgi:hypothetical protein
VIARLGRQTRACNGTTSAAPASIPSSASASRCSATVATPIVGRRQRRVDADVVQSRFNDIRQFPHLTEHGRTRLAQIMAGVGGFKAAHRTQQRPSS